MNKEIANFIYEQLAGEHNGHMAAIPNNPVFQSLLVAFGADNSKERFARFLIDVASYLDDGAMDKLEDDILENAASHIRDYIAIDREGEKIGAEYAESVVYHGTKRMFR